MAANVGAAVTHDEHCPPNVEVIFTTDPQTVLNYVARRAPLLLGFHDASQAKRLMTVSHTIQAWCVTTTRNASGLQTVDLDLHHTPGGTAGSRLGEDITAAVTHVAVIGNGDKVAGYPIDAISDYIAMLVLSYAPSLEDCNELPSILDLLSASCGSGSRPEALSASDEAYLKALYHTDLERSGFLERSHIQL